jgi:hypothetical protein
VRFGGPSAMMVVHLLGSVALHAFLLATASHAPLGVFPL